MTGAHSTRIARSTFGSKCCPDPTNPPEVYAFLEVLANHEPFTDHMMVDWAASGSGRASAHALEEARASGRWGSGWRWSRWGWGS